MITTVTLNPALDKTITVKNLEYGRVNRVHEAHAATGGKGLNVSKVLIKLGNETTTIGLLGKRNKAVMMPLLKLNLTDMDFVYVDDETRTNTVLVELEKGITTNINEEGFIVTDKHIEKTKRMVQKYAHHSDYMVFSGSAPQGMNTSIYRELIELVREETKTVLDADDELLLEGLKASPYLIKPNVHELENAFDVKLTDDESIIKLARRVILEYKIVIVLISMGGDGCLLVTAEEAYKALPIPVEVKSTVGAGDSLVGGFLHGLVGEMSLADALAYGTVCGALAVTREGVGNFELAEVEAMKGKVVVQKL